MVEYSAMGPEALGWRRDWSGECRERRVKAPKRQTKEMEGPQNDGRLVQLHCGRGVPRVSFRVDMS